MKRKIITATLMLGVSLSLLSANVCQETEVHVGSIKQMDLLIEKCEKLESVSKTVDLNVSTASASQLENILVVSKLVSVYPNEPEAKTQIIKSVLKYSEEYDIDPLTLTALIAKESSMNKGAKHGSVFVKIPTAPHWTKIKSARVTAVGMGGVIFEIWKYELAEIGITSREELFGIETNIKASAFILSIYTHERKQLKHTDSREQSALLRYYGVTRNKWGVPNKTYSTQVYKIKNSIEG